MRTKHVQSGCTLCAANSGQTEYQRCWTSARRQRPMYARLAHAHVKHKIFRIFELWFQISRLWTPPVFMISHMEDVYIQIQKHFQQHIMTLSILQTKIDSLLLIWNTQQIPKIRVFSASSAIFNEGKRGCRYCNHN